MIPPRRPRWSDCKDKKALIIAMKIPSKMPDPEGWRCIAGAKRQARLCQKAFMQGNKESVQKEGLGDKSPRRKVWGRKSPQVK